MKRFTDRVAVVTGSASGIGRAVAVALAARGCDLALVDIDEDGLHQTAHMVADAGRRASVHRADVADRARMQALVEEVEREHGRVDILVNNAGVTVAASFEEHSFEDLEWVLGINLWGVIHGCKLFLPLLRRQDEAYIVNISSLFGLLGIPRQSSYCATKFAVAGLSRALAAELSDSPVRVLSVHPGGIRTNIAKSGRFLDAKLQKRSMAFFEKRGMPPERAAEKIVTAMTTNTERLLVTREAYLGDALKRLFPAVPSRWISWIHGRVT